MSQYRHHADRNNVDPQWKQDLHQNENLDERAMADGRSGRTAATIKDLQQGPLRLLSHEQLKEIPVLDVGRHLRQGATYLDLADERRQPFTAMGSMVADADHYYAPKDDMDYMLWNRLIGVTPPERQSSADEQQPGLEPTT